ncbi:unnamed protein product [Bemisia tabaci]|uniref:F-box domain-containing protein n=1 Tax=Bemisia tabaci TaxID=7038 RepID=A0A9P0F4L4_BEMTA|nr:unnamed protein product [Bemisia tabaci]
MKGSEETKLSTSPTSKRIKLNMKSNDRKSALLEEDLSDMGVDLLYSKDDDPDAPFSADDSENECPPTPELSQGAVLKSSDSSSRVLKCLKPSNVEVTPDDFLRFRKRTSVSKFTGKDLFATLSDEILLMIFKWLPKETLYHCIFVCKRWQRIVYDEKLWYKIELSSKVLKPDNVAYALMRNPRLLRMSQTLIHNPMFDQTESYMSKFVSKLEYLDLSMAVISKEDLAILMSRCKNLKKLSLEACPTDTKVCEGIGQNTKLEVLNMALCTEVDADGVKFITSNCPKLLEWNLGWTNLSPEAVEIVCSFVSEKIEALNLSGAKSVSNEDVEELVYRCKQLKELDLSDCTELTVDCVSQICGHLSNLQTLSLSRCYNIQPSCYWKLFMLPNLKHLNLFGLVHDKHLDKLEKNAHPVEINKMKFSSIARPTVGVRRTSIWGLRVRH